MTTDRVRIRWHEGHKAYSLWCPATGWVDKFGRASDSYYCETREVAVMRRRDLNQYRRDAIDSRLEYLRGELRAERISYGELAELQSLAQFIAPGDVELLEAAGVPEELAT